MRRGGEGWPPGHWVSDTRITQLFQLMCYNKAADIPAYKCTLGVLAGGSPPGTERQHV